MVSELKLGYRLAGQYTGLCCSEASVNRIAVTSLQKSVRAGLHTGCLARHRAPCDVSGRQLKLLPFGDAEGVVNEWYILALEFMRDVLADLRL